MSNQNDSLSERVGELLPSLALSGRRRIEVYIFDYYRT